jgi:hypothetical protein
LRNLRNDRGVATTAPTLSGDQIAEMLALTKGSDSVELKVTVPESAHRSTIAALGIDPLQAQIRQVFFFDTPTLDLDKQGVVVRARRIQNKGDDAVVKLRPVVPDNLAPEIRQSPNFTVEVDALPGGFVCSGAMKRALDGTEVLKVVVDGRPLRKLLSKEQRALYAEHVQGVELDDLSILGPIFVLKGRFVGFDRRLVAEMWLYPDGSRILELSTKCRPDEPFQVAAQARAFFAERGIDISGEQQTKTRKALRFFAKALQEA